MASIPHISRKWFPIGDTNLTGKSRWQHSTSIHTSKPKSKVHTAEATGFNGLQICFKKNVHTDAFSASMQAWTCTTSTCDRHAARTRRLCRSCWFTAGRAPSTSSTRFCRFSRRTGTAWRLRSYARPSPATVSQMRRANKVSLIIVALRPQQQMFFFYGFLRPFRIRQSRCCPRFPDTDGTFGILAVLSAGRRLGLAHHHQHVTDEAHVRAQDETLHATSYHVHFPPSSWLFFLSRSHCDIVI